MVCRKINDGVGAVRSSHQTVSGASKKLVLPSIVDTSLFHILYDVKLAELFNI